jgi:hypothetical protein
MHEPMTTAAARPAVPRGVIQAASAMLGSSRNTRVLIAAVAAVVVLAIVLVFLVTRGPGVRSVAFYPAGRATFTINGGKPLILPLIDKGATLMAPGGAGLTWQNADGWYLNLNGPFSFDGSTPTSQPAVVPPASVSGGVAPVDANGSFQLNGADFGRWAGIDSNACAIVYTEVARTKIAGSIKCRGVIWYDKSSVEHVQKVDVPPFDLDVKFEATGDGKAPVNPS